MQTAEQVIEDALRQFKEQAEEQAKLDRRNKAENQKRRDRERAEVREWLAQHIPQPLMQYIDFGDYSHDAASSYYPRSPYGVILEMAAPNIAPIRFRVRFRINAASDEEAFEFQPLEDGGGDGFTAPIRGHIDSDPDYDDGKPYIRWDWPYYSFLDFMEALGRSAALYEEQGQRLEEKLRAAIEEWQATRYMDVEPPPFDPRTLPLEERQVRALEAIADALGTLAHYNC